MKKAAGINAEGGESTEVPSGPDFEEVTDSDIVSDAEAKKVVADALRSPLPKHKQYIYIYIYSINRVS